MPGYKALIFDLGDVLFSWSAPKDARLSPESLKAIFSSDIWFDYERGQLSENNCYAQLAERFSLDSSDVAQTISLARDSLRLDDTLISVIRELKANADQKLSIYAMSNISKADYEVLRSKFADWSTFDGVFTSGHVGMRKPDLCFYRYVLKAISASPTDVIFVDDRPENVLSAQSIGIHGIVFKNTPDIRRTLKNVLGDPVQRARDYLTRNAKDLYTLTKTDIIIYDNFTQLLILEVTGDRALVHIEPHERTWNFFIGEPKLTTDYYPDDLDTTSIASTVLGLEAEVITSVMDGMLRYVNEDGIVLTYFDHSRPRVDPVVCVNVLSLFYKHGRGGDLPLTLHWVREVLFHRAYLEGTRYYVAPEAFLYFLSRLCQLSNDAAIQLDLKPLLAERVKERIGAGGDALCLAMRILTCKSVGISNSTDTRSLLSMQCEDGGWLPGWIYRYGSSGIELGNRGLTTALAGKAIETETTCGANQPFGKSRSITCCIL